MTPWAKAIVAAVGAGIIALAAALTDNTVTNPEKVQIAVAVVTSVSVWLTANVGVPLWSSAKFVTAAVLAGLNAVAGYLAEGDTLSSAMWLNVAIAALTAVGVWAVPNTSATPPVTAAPPS